jgi:hypothetical protein
VRFEHRQVYSPQIPCRQAPHTQTSLRKSRYAQPGAATSGFRTYRERG